MKHLLLTLLFLAAATRGLADARIEQNRIILDTPITFATGSDELTPDSAPALKQLAAFLSAKSALTLLRVEGHVSSSAAQPQTLSERRALAVARQLVALGVECSRMLPVGFGATKPIAAPGQNPENTRIEIHVATLRGRRVGGMPEDGGGQVAGNPCGEK